MTPALCIGLTGGIGSGKSAASGVFQSLGVPLIDADDVSRQVVSPGLPALKEIIEHFGTDVVDEHGELDRRCMRQIVFNDEQARGKLESIIHPRVYEEIRKFVETVSFPYCIISSPLLIEKQDHYNLDRILVIDTPESLQLARASKRDNSNEEDIEKIIHSQIPRQTRLQAADDIIVNDSDLEFLQSQVNSMHDKYLALAADNSEVQLQ